MIDDVAAREYIMEMNKQGLNNLLLALNLEMMLTEEFKDRLDVKYSPLTSSVLVSCKPMVGQQRKNVVAAIKRHMPTKPKRVINSGARDTFVAVKMDFEDGFNIVIQYAVDDASNIHKRL